VRGNPTLSTNGLSEENTIKIYPNPATNYANISFPNTIDICKIEIIDLLGKTIFLKEIKPLFNEFKMDFQGYKEGIYFVKIATEKIKKTIKIIVKK
jgi:hypothetical protein